MRSMSLLEWGVTISVVGSVLAASVPTFVRELHASRFTEAVDGVRKIATSAAAYAQDKPLPKSFPPPVGLTPEHVPAGVAVVDPPGTWDQPTWQALDFRIERPHRYAFSFDVSVEPKRIWFSAQAHGDLNGDGVLSTFEAVGERRPGQGVVIQPGLNIDKEVE